MDAANAVWFFFLKCEPISLRVHMVKPKSVLNFLLFLNRHQDHKHQHSFFLFCLFPSLGPTAVVHNVIWHRFTTEFDHFLQGTTLFKIF